MAGLFRQGSETEGHEYQQRDEPLPRFLLTVQKKLDPDGLLQVTLTES